MIDYCTALMNNALCYVVHFMISNLVVHDHFICVTGIANPQAVTTDTEQYHNRLNTTITILVARAMYINIRCTYIASKITSKVLHHNYTCVHHVHQSVKLVDTTFAPSSHKLVPELGTVTIWWLPYTSWISWGLLNVVCIDYMVH